MVTTANLSPGALVVDDYTRLDPFNTRAGHRQRYSALDDSQSLYLNGSPSQAKRALEAHLAETTRRLQEASHLGNALVQQRKELEEHLHDLEGQQADNEIDEETRVRLAELEKEFKSFIIMGKKMYYGTLVKPDGSHATEVKGIAAVRKDRVQIARTVSSAVCESICQLGPEAAIEDVSEIVAEAIASAKLGALPFDDMTRSVRRKGSSFVVYEDDAGNVIWLSQDDIDSKKSFPKPSGDYVAKAISSAADPILEACGMPNSAELSHRLAARIMAGLI